MTEEQKAGSKLLAQFEGFDIKEGRSGTVYRDRQRLIVVNTPSQNHKWKNNACTVCGCKRTKIAWFFAYRRSGINYQYRPECIDWEIENAKTID